MKEKKKIENRKGKENGSIEAGNEATRPSDNMSTLITRRSKEKIFLGCVQKRYDLLTP